jgi:hypothetical protein
MEKRREIKRRGTEKKLIIREKKEKKEEKNRQRKEREGE